MVSGAFIQCCELSATRESVCELPFCRLHPHQESSCPGLTTVDEARLWEKRTRMVHTLSGQLVLQKEKHFLWKEKNVPICRSWVRWGGETLIWDCVNLERWSHSENSYRSKEPKMTSVLKDTPKYDE